MSCLECFILMIMIILIDGYNILKLIHGPDLTETQRSAFINLMGRYMKKRQHKVIVVFDAGPCTYPMQEKQHGVQVVFSGEYQSADDSIVNFVRDHASKEIVVITKDRELIAHVTSLHAEIIDPLEFYKKVQQILQGSKTESKEHEQTIAKLSLENDPDLDALMKEAASMQMPDKDRDDSMIARYHEPKGKSISKKQRARLKILDKL